jgi:copper chaperone
MTTRTYVVPTISCAHCKAAIEGEVSQVTGVEVVDVDIDSKVVRVDGDAADADIRAAIDEAGYEVAG